MSGPLYLDKGKHAWDMTEGMHVVVCAQGLEKAVKRLSDEGRRSREGMCSVICSKVGLLLRKLPFLNTLCGGINDQASAAFESRPQSHH